MASILNKYLDRTSVRHIYNTLNQRRTLAAEFSVDLIYDQTTPNKGRAIKEMSRAKRMFILTKGNEIVLLVPYSRVRSTINYETYLIKRSGEFTKNQMIWGAVAKMLPHYETMYACYGGYNADFYAYSDSVGANVFATKKSHQPRYFNPTKEEELEYMERLRKRLDLLIRLSGIIEKAKAIATQRVESNQFDSAVKICTWLTNNQSNQRILDGYLYQATGVSPNNSSYYRSNKNDFSSMIQSVESEHRRASYPKHVYREYAFKAFAAYKKSFNDAVYGDLIKKMSK